MIIKRQSGPIICFFTQIMSTKSPPSCDPAGGKVITGWVFDLFGLHFSYLYLDFVFLFSDSFDPKESGNKTLTSFSLPC